MTKINKIKESLSRWGVLRTSLFGFMKLCPWLKIYSVGLRPQSAKLTEGKLPNGVSSIRRATLDDLLFAIEEMPDELSLEFVYGALTRGDLCIGVFDGLHMISFAWRSFSTAPHADGLWVSFEKSHNYGYKAFTRPEYRRKGLNKYVGAYADKFGIERGFTRQIDLIDITNFISLAAAEKKGSKRVGYAGYVKVFGNVFPFRSPGAKEKSFGFYRRSTEE